MTIMRQRLVKLIFPVFALLVATSTAPAACYKIQETSPATSSTGESGTVENFDSDCIDDLSVISLLELQLLSEPQAERTKQRHYVLCPNTIFTIGYPTESKNKDEDVDKEEDNRTSTSTKKQEHERTNNKLEYVNGSMPLVLVNPNIRISCGRDGASSNQCILKGGDHQILVPSSKQLKEKELDGALVDVSRTVLKGLTLEGATDIAFSVVTQGSPDGGDDDGVSLEDCIFQNQTSGTFVVYLDAKVVASSGSSSSSGGERPVSRNRKLESPWDSPFLGGSEEGGGGDGGEDELSMELATESPSSSGESNLTNITDGSSSSGGGESMTTSTTTNINNNEEDKRSAPLTVRFENCQFRFNRVEMAVVGSIHDIHLDFQSTVFYKNSIPKQNLGGDGIGSLIWATTTLPTQRGQVRVDQCCFLDNVYGLSAMLLNGRYGSLNLVLEPTNYMQDHARYELDQGCDEGILHVDNSAVNLGQALGEGKYQCFYLSSANDQGATLPTCATNFQAGAGAGNSDASSRAARAAVVKTIGWVAVVFATVVLLGFDT